MKKVLKWVGIIFVALLVIGLIFGKNDDKASTSSSDSSAATSSDNAIKLTENESKAVKDLIRDEVESSFNGNSSQLDTEYVVVSAREMQKTYANNEARGDKTYKDKKIIISGTIDSIDSSFGDIPVVTLKTGEMFNKVHINFAREYRDLAAELNKNQNVKYACIGGSIIIGSPSVKDCTPVSAVIDELTDELVSSVNKSLKNPSKASEYDKKTILFAKLASVVTNDFKVCRATDQKCFSSNLAKYGKDNLKNNEEIKAVIEKLGIDPSTLKI
ncbi:OB-fold putative lipoprotein [Xenorhabdus sp. XENO-1]|uniref:OB-fold putative lipoprotein n=1 Tax=Xenorhabdus bovienii TaxID=40576 RepID=UPI0020CA359E|nr:OB-fold putative lipoprotein [Xenorhabdus bovienii]MCP9268832.1 OB-fold putative lipoprotein [Xenorhabdus bovienii subsp. africana]